MRVEIGFGKWIHISLQHTIPLRNWISQLTTAPVGSKAQKLFRFDIL